MTPMNGVRSKTSSSIWNASPPFVARPCLALWERRPAAIRGNGVLWEGRPAPIRHTACSRDALLTHVSIPLDGSSLRSALLR